MKKINLQKERTINDKDFKEGARQTVSCNGSINEEVLYKSIINALKSNHAELCIISETEGLKYFTNLNLMPLFDVIVESARLAAEEFNLKVQTELAKAINHVDRTAKA